MIIALAALVVGSILASGILFKHQRALTFIATAGTLFEAQWLLLALIARKWLVMFDSSVVYDIGAAILLLLWLTQIRKWSCGWRLSLKHIQLDLAAAAVVVLALVAAGAVAQFNGWHNGAWVTHGFFNGDVATMASLVQKALLNPGLNFDNPFAAGTGLEYPTLLHAGLADFIKTIGLTTSWLNYLPVLTFAQILFVIPLFFLLWDVVLPQPPQRWMLWLGVKSRSAIVWLQALLTFFVLAISWDAYIYPQSHFFLIGLFLLAAALLLQYEKQNSLRSWFVLGAAYTIACVLWHANAVTGAAALLLALTQAVKQAADVSAPKLTRVFFAVAAAGWVGVYFWFSPGESALGKPHFSYTAALDMLRLSPWIILLVIAVWSELSRRAWLVLASTALLGLSVLVFLFSTRNIVVENASRFMYHALLIGFPLIIYVVIRGYYLMKKELFYSANSLPSKLAAFGMAVFLLVIFSLPALASVYSTHDNLMRKDEQTISSDYVQALSWVNEQATTSAVFAANPNEPWAIPMFTGRSLLRTNYWLSPNDETQKLLNRAFEGNTQAQLEIVQNADYILLTSAEKANWALASQSTPAYTSGDVFIYSAK